MKKCDQELKKKILQFHILLMDTGISPLRIGKDILYIFEKETLDSAEEILFDCNLWLKDMSILT